MPGTLTFPASSAFLRGPMVFYTTEHFMLMLIYTKVYFPRELANIKVLNF